MSNLRKRNRPTADQYIFLHAIWWILGWLFVIFNYGMSPFYDSLIRFLPALMFVVPCLAFLTIIIGPILEYVYHEYFGYSLSSLTSLVLICFILAILTSVVPFIVIPYVFTPFLPLLFESLMPLLNTRSPRQRIRLEFTISLFSFSIIDISIIAVEFVALSMFR